MKCTFAVLAALAACSAADIAQAIPSPFNSTTPACIALMGQYGGQADPAGTFTIVLRDVANVPLAGETIRIDVSGCTDLRLSSQQQAGVTVVCSPGVSYAEGTTDANGEFRASLRGYSVGPGSLTANAGRIYGAGVQLAAISLCAFDLTGADGVGANDLSVFFGDFGSGNYYPRSDFDCSGHLGSNDLSAWLGVFGSGYSSQGGDAGCP